MTLIKYSEGESEWTFAHHPLMDLPLIFYMLDERFTVIQPKLLPEFASREEDSLTKMCLWGSRNNKGRGLGCIQKETSNNHTEMNGDSKGFYYNVLVEMLDAYKHYWRMNNVLWDYELFNRPFTNSQEIGVVCSVNNGPKLLLMLQRYTNPADQDKYWEIMVREIWLSGVSNIYQTTVKLRRDKRIEHRNSSFYPLTPQEATKHGE